MGYCGNCGEKIEKGANFCGKCGAVVEKEQSEHGDRSIFCSGI